MIYFLNGKFVNKNKAKIKVNDLGLLRGYGVFDYLRTYNRIPFHLNEHLVRFFDSAKRFNLKIPYSKEEIKNILFKLIKKNKGELTFRIILTGGESSDGKISKKPNFFIIVEKPLSYPAIFYQKGIKVITLNYLRDFPEIKSLNYALALSYWQKVLKEKAQEILYLFKNRIYEASTSNFFIIKNGVIFSPKENVFEGVTKKVVIQLAKKYGFKIKEKKLFLDEILRADEIFITATSKEIMPVVKIDNHLINKEKVGEITKKLIEIFKEYTNNYSL